MERKEFVNFASTLCEIGVQKGNWDKIADLAGCIQLEPREEGGITVKVVDDEFFKTVFLTWAPLSNHPDQFMSVLLPFVLGASFSDKLVQAHYRENDNVLIRKIDFHVTDLMIGLLQWGLIPDKYAPCLNWSTSLPVPHFAQDHFISFVDSDDLKRAWQSLYLLDSKEADELDRPTTLIQFHWTSSVLAAEFAGMSLNHESIFGMKKEEKEEESERKVASPKKGAAPANTAFVTYYSWDGDEEFPTLAFRIKTSRRDFRWKYINLYFDAEERRRRIEVHLSTHSLFGEGVRGLKIDLETERTQADLSTAILDVMKEFGFDQVIIAFDDLELIND